MLKDKVECFSIFKGGKIIGSDFEGSSYDLADFWINKWIQGELIYQNRNMMNVHFVNSIDYFSWVLTNVYASNSKWGRKFCRNKFLIRESFLLRIIGWL